MSGEPMSEAVPADEPLALAVPLAGVNLVEASAGTGKTWTLSGLFLRLVVEAGLEVDRVLTVTYTRAAMAELAARIRRRLTDMLEALDGTGGDDILCRALAARLADPAVARLRVVAALRNLDAAAIHTIHAFCQRVLADHALACGRPFAVALAPEDDAVGSEVVQDFWRRELGRNGPGTDAVQRLLVAHLLRQGLLPERLAEWVGRLATTHDLRTDTGDAAAAHAELTRYLALRQSFAQAWREGRDSLAAAVAGHPGLDRRTYQSRYLTGWLSEMDRHLADPGPLPAATKNLHRLGHAALVAACRDQAPPEHPLPAAVDAYREALAERDVALAVLEGGMVARLTDELRRERRRRNLERRVAGYDDVVTELAAALDGPGGDALAAALRQRYPAALVDEFQDTDALQYRLFRRIYGEAPPQALFLVGDPKQAIYSFRGADVHAYLAAARQATHLWRLAENRRSVAPLVRAVDCLFAGEVPFRLPAIVHPPVRAAGEHPRLEEDGTAVEAPMRLRLLPAAGGKPLSREAARSAAAAMTADEIHRLLVAAGARLAAARLEGRHIAVLVGTHSQAALVRQALAQRNLASASLTTASVFEADEAELLERLLVALVEPQRIGPLAAVLASDLFGVGAAELARLEDDPSVWDRWQTAARSYQDLWRQKGVAVMLRRLLSDHGGAQRFARHADGERRLTNLMQLAELAQAAAATHAGIEATLQWLAASRRQGRGGEAAEMRLESDENLVRILTIHGAKGLEFPVTFCPFLWDVPERKETAPIYHDADDGERPVVDLGSPRAGEAARRCREEALSERLRLAYVALTRASHRCEWVWGEANGAGRSALAWLLHRHHGDELPDEASRRQAIERLVARSGGSIALCPPPPAAARSTDAAAPLPTLAALELRRAVPQPWRVASFSSLVRGVASDWRAELPDHDPGVGEAAAPAAGGDRRRFPRGAGAGTCLHGILEAIDFTAPPAAWRPAIERGLAGAGYPGGWRDELADWLAQALHACWPDGGTLAALGRAHTVREMEFHLPATGDAAGLAALLARHGWAVPPLAPQRLAGFLKGYIDLVFERDGRYHLADYKSNWLGADAADYRHERLEAAMQREGYFLQGALYALALHRHLRLRLAGYEPERHFGGIHYLFLRGMGGDAGNGVLSFRPRVVLLESLDAFFGGAAAAP